MGRDGIMEPSSLDRQTFEDWKRDFFTPRPVDPNEWMSEKSKRRLAMRKEEAWQESERVRKEELRLAKLVNVDVK